MSSLTVSLLIVAGVGLAAIIAYNLWLGRQRQQSLSSSQADADGAGAGASSEGSGSGGAGQRQEPRLGAGGADQGSDGAALPPPQGISAATDCIVELPLEETMSGEQLITLLKGLRRVGAKPVIVEGQGEGGEGDSWSALEPGSEYRAVRIAILLANRHGPLNAMEFSEFVGALQDLAEQLSALADTPEMSEVLADARELDMLCAQLDAQIGVNVIAPEPVAVEALASMGRLLNLHDRGAGRFARLGAAGETFFTMALGESGRTLNFLLDVPRTPAAVKPLEQMFECAKQFAQRLYAEVVDDGGRPLDETAIAAIGRQLDVRYASLEAAGFPAGSPVALRLFN